MLMDSGCPRFSLWACLGKAGVTDEGCLPSVTDVRTQTHLDVHDKCELRTGQAEKS